MTPRRKRLLLVGLVVLGVSAAVGLALTAFQRNLLYFFTPTQVAAGEAPSNYPFRIGGLVKQGSVHHEDDGLTVRFVVTDGRDSVPVVYKGVLPDLFREGQGVVARGRLDGAGGFRAQEVLAKHDEKYMPPEVADALAKNKSSARASGGAMTEARR